MTISSLSSSSLLTQALAASGVASGSVDPLLAAVDQSQSASATTADPLLQSLVTLGSSGASPASLTYNAQGLLNQAQSASLLADPLLQSDGGSGGDSAGTDGSLLSSLVATSQGSSSGTAAASSTGTSGAATANLVQLIQQSPSLASAYIEGQIDQSVISTLP